VTSADPSGSSNGRTRPIGPARSTTIGSLKFAPPSLEKASITRLRPSPSVNQAITTREPATSITGGFTGQPRIVHPSA
jgi:hypothetical protein